MLKRLFAVLALTMLGTAAFSQDVTGNGSGSVPEISKPSRDFLLLQLGYNGWAGKPDSVK